jgi:hypothetical protein
MAKSGSGRETSLAMLWSIAIILLIGAGGGFLVLTRLPDAFNAAPMTIVVLLVAGFVAVTLLLYLGTLVIRMVGLGTRKEALGMPEGSIRALIAMSLILMFAIIGVTVLYAGQGGDPLVSRGISAEELARLENVQIIAISVVDPAASPGAERFDVTARPELSQAGHDFGLQLLTTVSTLVVAVAGFYFGARAVAQATKTAGAIQAASTTPPGGLAGSGLAPGGLPPAGDEEQPLDEAQVIGAVEDADAIAEAEAADAAAEADAATAAADAAAAGADAEAADAAAADTDADTKKKPGGTS